MQLFLFGFILFWFIFNLAIGWLVKSEEAFQVHSNLSFMAISETEDGIFKVPLHWARELD